jgi:hypothetical protein
MHHMYSMPPYPYLATDYGTQLSLFTHHMWIGGFLVVGAAAHAAIFMVRDYDPTNNYNNLLDRVIRHRDAIISHLNWVCIFLGLHSFGLYVHNDTMSALGRPQDMFSDTAIQLQPVFAQFIQHTHFTAPQLTAPNAFAATSLTWGGDVVAVGGKVAMMPISLGTADFLVWVMMDQVKLRYMLEQLDPIMGISALFLLLILQEEALNDSCSPCLNAPNTCVLHRRCIAEGEEDAQVYLLNFSNIKGSPLGTREKLSGRANQQVTMASKKHVGTSETTREAVPINLFDFSDFEKCKPSHIKHLDTTFLTWLIGFIEGDGSFWVKGSGIGASFILDANSRRAEFEITQSIDNVKLIHKIRTKLGFGRVYTFIKNNGLEYCRFYTSERENIIKLVHLLNGNLVLEKRCIQFQGWVNAINLAWGLQIPIKPCKKKVSLNDAWLSGFSDADAGFFTNVTCNFRLSSLAPSLSASEKKSDGSYYHAFQTKFYITQDGETSLLERIKILVGATNKITLIKNKESSKAYNRLEIHGSGCTQLLINYFTAFPLQGVRKIDCLRWARVHGYKLRHVILTERAAKRLARLIYSLEEPNGFSQQFLAEEEEILKNLPLNQRNSNYVSRKKTKKNEENS